MYFGEITAANSGFWGTASTTPTGNNYALRINSTETYLNAVTNVIFTQNANEVGRYTRNKWTLLL